MSIQEQTKDLGVAFIGFMKAAQAKVDAERERHGSRKLEIEAGPKYIRVIAANTDGSSRYAYCFIDKETGNVLKPAGWKGPEKKNPRSNIFAEDFGASGVTGYGTTYLR